MSISAKSLAFILITIALIGGAGYYFGYPTYQYITSNRERINQKEAEKQTLDKKANTLSQYAENNQTIDEHAAKMATFVPEKPRLGDFMISIESLIAQINLGKKTDFTLSDFASEAPKSRENIKTQSSVLTTAKAHHFTITGESTLSRIAVLLNQLRHMDRLAEITSLTLDATQDNLLSFTIEGNIFSELKTAADKTELDADKLIQDSQKRLGGVQSYGRIIDIPNETGFGRANPFVPTR